KVFKSRYAHAKPSLASATDPKAVAEDRIIEQFLEREGMNFRALIEHSTDIINVLTRTGTILYASPSETHILGYDSGELLGKNAFRMMHPKDMPHALKEFWKGVRHPGTVQAATFRFRHKNGSWCWLECTGVYRKNADGRSVAITNSRDVTARLEAEFNL